jgi:hypothetical protein
MSLKNFTTYNIAELIIKNRNNAEESEQDMPKARGGPTAGWETTVQDFIRLRLL